jgi:hypothetical protein
MQATAGWVRELPTRIGRRGAWRHRRPGAGGLGDHRGVGCAGGSCRAVVVDGLIARVRRRSRSPCPCGDTVRLDEGAEGVPRPASHRRASRRRPAALRHQPQPDCSPDAGSRPPTSTVRVGRTMRSRQPWRTDDLVPRIERWRGPRSPRATVQRLRFPARTGPAMRHLPGISILRERRRGLVAGRVQRVPPRPAAARKNWSRRTGPRDGQASQRRAAARRVGPAARLGRPPVGRQVSW